MGNRRGFHPALVAVPVGRRRVGCMGAVLEAPLCTEHPGELSLSRDGPALRWHLWCCMLLGMARV